MSAEPGTEEIERAAAVLRAGGTAIVPTDTVYGLAALPTVPGATDALFALKGRSTSQALAVLVADADQALALADLAALSADDAERVVALAGKWWPGALTIVAPRVRSAGSLDLGGDPSTIGLRCPASPLVRALAAEVGPLATTSANRSGEPTPSTAAQAAASLAGEVGIVLDGGPCGATPSTVVSVSGRSWTVLRRGAIAVDDLGLPRVEVHRSGEVAS